MGIFSAFKKMQILSPILEEICPIRIFLIKDFALFGGQVVRVVCKQIEYGLLVKREQVLPYTIHIVHPINFIGFLILVKRIHKSYSKLPNKFNC
jgi:hypothetical protein